MAHEPEILASGRFVRLVRDGRWEYVDRLNASAAVVLVAVTDDQRLLLVEQYRVPLRQRVIELPAGLVGDDGQPHETLLSAARRELAEETGYQAESWVEAAAGPPSAGLATEIVTFFVVRGLRRLAQRPATDEQISLHEIPLGEVDRWLAEAAMRGLAIDPKIFAGLYLLTRTP